MVGASYIPPGVWYSAALLVRINETFMNDRDTVAGIQTFSGIECLRNGKTFLWTPYQINTHFRSGFATLFDIPICLLSKLGVVFMAMIARGTALLEFTTRPGVN